MCISTTEALYLLKGLIKDDVDACCEASMDKNDVILKLEKLKKYLEKVDSEEPSDDFRSALDSYY